MILTMILTYSLPAMRAARRRLTNGNECVSVMKACMLVHSLDHPNFFFYFFIIYRRLLHLFAIFLVTETRVPSLLVNRCKIADTKTSYILVEAARSLAELYDARREKPSVLVTSPGSPDLHAQGRGRHSRHPTGNANVGGSIQVKLGFDPVGLQLIVTIICAAGLTPKSNGQPRNPYAKVFLLPDKR